MNLFIKCISAAAIVASLGAASVVPAQAQGFNFQVNPPGSNFSFGFGVGRPDRPGYNRCLSQRSLARAIADQGYRNVRITDYGRRTTEARGVSRGVTYALIADSCTGRIIDRERIRRW